MTRMSPNGDIDMTSFSPARNLMNYVENGTFNRYVNSETLSKSQCRQFGICERKSTAVPPGRETIYFSDMTSFPINYKPDCMENSAGQCSHFHNGILT